MSVSPASRIKSWKLFKNYSPVIYWSFAFTSVTTFLNLFRSFVAAFSIVNSSVVFRASAADSQNCLKTSTNGTP